MEEHTCTNISRTQAVSLWISSVKLTITDTTEFAYKKSAPQRRKISPFITYSRIVVVGGSNQAVVSSILPPATTSGSH